MSFVSKDEGEKGELSVFLKLANCRFSFGATPPANFPPRAPGAQMHGELVLWGRLPRPVTAATWKSKPDSSHIFMTRIAGLIYAFLPPVRRRA